MNPLKVLLVLEYPTISGGENSLLAVLPILSQCAEIFCLLPQQSELIPRLNLLKIRNECYPFKNLDPSFNAHSREDAIKKCCLNFTPDIIHANSLSMGRFLGRCHQQFRNLCNKGNVRITSHIRDMIRLSKNEIQCLNQCDQLVAVSHATADYLQNQGVDQSLLTVIYNGINLETAQPVSSENNYLSPMSNFRDESGILQDAHIAIYAGQLGLRKGVCYLLDAWKKIIHEPVMKNWHLCILGARFSCKQESIDYENQLHQFVQTDQELIQRTHFMGYRNDVLRIFKQGDLLIHPALQEPFGRVLLEAAATELPILATTAGGTPEMLEHLHSAYLVPPGNVNALAEGWLKLAEDHLSRKTFAIHARESIRDKFCPEQSAAGLFDLWQSLKH